MHGAQVSSASDWTRPRHGGRGALSLGQSNGAATKNPTMEVLPQREGGRPARLATVQRRRGGELLRMELPGSS